MKEHIAKSNVVQAFRPARGADLKVRTTFRNAVKIYGRHDDRTVQQLERCVAAEPGAQGVLCADGHVGYSMPIGGVVAYKRFVSPSGVGYDIACGNMAVKTNVMARDVPHADMERLAHEIRRRVSFGIGPA